MTTFSFWACCPAALLTVICVSSARAQGLPDPTRPAVALKETALATAEDETGVRLLLVGPKRKYALIGGELLEQGQTGSQGKLLAIRPNEVVIESENGRETLSISPGVVIKRPAQPLATGTKTRPTTINLGNKP